MSLFVKVFVGNVENDAVMQGEMMALRLSDDMTLPEELWHFGLLSFDDGGMKCLVGALVWVGLVYFLSKEPLEYLRHPQVLKLVKSLLRLPTIFKHQAENPAQQMIQRIIKQNVDSKKLPVSSFEWAGILVGLKPHTDESFGFTAAIDLYNQNPEVLAHGGDAGETQNTLFANALVLLFTTSTTLEQQ